MWLLQNQRSCAVLYQVSSCFLCLMGLAVLLWVFDTSLSSGVTGYSKAFPLCKG